ncbi:patatin-like phospholipase family protein [Actibacterium sp. D379-3]
MGTTKRINLALQGGGAHGAFTWGVLDRILEDEEIEIAGITGTSAGALNGAALKAGLAAGGRDKARENLDWLWGQVGATGGTRLTQWLSEFNTSPGLFSRAVGHSVPYSLADSAARMFSPYYYGPFYRHPLQRVVEQFDFDNVCADQGPRFFVCATNVRTGRARIFTRDEITSDAILASACLPTVFQAVEIDDPETGTTEAYWDGGYSGNPALFPLYDRDLPDDIVIVAINPQRRERLPVTPQEIQNRVNEISFNASLLRDLRSIAFVKRLLTEGAIRNGSMKDVLVHMISDDELMRKLGGITKSMPNPVLLQNLRQAGRDAADQFLTDHKTALNNEPTVDLAAMFA